MADESSVTMDGSNGSVEQVESTSTTEEPKFINENSIVNADNEIIPPEVTK